MMLDGRWGNDEKLMKLVQAKPVASVTLQPR